MWFHQGHVLWFEIVFREGLARNLFSLKSFTDQYCPDLVFLSEPQIFQIDLESNMDYFKGDYSFSLNSKDLYDMDLPLTCSRAKGGLSLCGKLLFTPTSVFTKLIVQPSSQ
jgi:hypothetical protein